MNYRRSGDFLVLDQPRRRCRDAGGRGAAAGREDRARQGRRPRHAAAPNKAKAQPDPQVDAGVFRRTTGAEGEPAHGRLNQWDAPGELMMTDRPHRNQTATASNRLMPRRASRRPPRKLPGGGRGTAGRSTRRSAARLKPSGVRRIRAGRVVVAAAAVVALVACLALGYGLTPPTREREADGREDRRPPQPGRRPPQPARPVPAARRELRERDPPAEVRPRPKRCPTAPLTLPSATPSRSIRRPTSAATSRPRRRPAGDREELRRRQAELRRRRSPRPRRSSTSS